MVSVVRTLRARLAPWAGTARGHLEPVLLWFLPEKIRQADTDTLRLARLSVAYLLAIPLWGPIFAYLVLLLGLPSVAKLIAFGMALGMTLLLVLKFTGSLTYLGIAMCGVIAFVTIGGAWVEGGITAPSVGWFPLAPMLAVLVAGRRAAIGYALLMVAALTVFLVLDRSGLSTPLFASVDDWRFVTLQYALTVGTVTLFVGLSSIFDSLKSSAVRSLHLIYDAIATMRRSDLQEPIRLRGTRDEIDAALAALEQLRTDVIDARERARETADLKLRFVTMASHEFRTPLAVICAATDAMARYGDRMTAAQRTERTERIHREIRHMTDLIDGVLDFGKLHANAADCCREPIDLRAWCAQLVTEAETTRDAVGRVVMQCTAPPTPVALDPRLGSRIVGNLLSNALKYSPADRPVEFDVAHADDATVIRIRDHGIGISAEDQAVIYEPFHRGGNVGGVDGHGLGLAITKGAVEAHGGSITIESQPGDGTTVTVVLPSGATDAG